MVVIKRKARSGIGSMMLINGVDVQDGAEGAAYWRGVIFLVITLGGTSHRVFGSGMERIWSYVLLPEMRHGICEVADAGRPSTFRFQSTSGQDLLDILQVDMETAVNTSLA